MDTFKVTVLDISAPTRNRRIYPSHEIEQAIKNCKWTLPVFMDASHVVGEDGAFALDRVAGIASGLCLEGKQLTANIKFYASPCGTIASQLIEACGHNAFEYTTCGTGTVTTDVMGNHIVTEFSLTAISMNSKNVPIQERFTETSND